jgi:mono/diheme cytochrome c family protein
MFKFLFCGALYVGIGLGIGAAQQTSLTIQAAKTPASDGKQMYVSYCAPCHGVDGRGQGPVAKALVAKPSDLSLLSKNNHGKYPAIHVLAVLQFGSPMEAHGTKNMPIWGPTFAAMEDRETSVDVKSLREVNLSRYIESFQAK